MTLFSKACVGVAALALAATGPLGVAAAHDDDAEARRASAADDAETPMRCRPHLGSRARLAVRDCSDASERRADYLEARCIRRLVTPRAVGVTFCEGLPENQALADASR